MVTVLVADYDAAIGFYRDVLGFRLVCDEPDGNKRWVVVSPGQGADLLLARASDDRQAARIGDQTGGRVGFFLYSADIVADHARLAAAGVAFEEPLRSEPYGRVAVFRDPFGNRWDLIEEQT